ncbi:MAG TPA: hypothetical protein VMM59_00735 [Thermohalobaculum sp.]|nr:hypothetical protein [Thermohalobaculum sp.]
MSKFSIGDLVVLKSGSMRMVVEELAEAGVACVWCHEGVIGRDSFDERLLNKWEYREEERAASRDGPRKPPRAAAERGADERPRRTGWDGKPREKKYFRKEGS